MPTHRLAVGLVLCITGCSGTRLVARPDSARGYEQAALRDVSATGRQGVNVEVEGVLGPLVAQEVCGGLVTYQLLYGTGQSIAGMSVFSGVSGVTISLPRERYAEVRDLRPLEPVRVRGYLSTWFADGCTWYTTDAGRYLWVDSIERIAPDKAAAQ